MTQNKTALRQSLFPNYGNIEDLTRSSLLPDNSDLTLNYNTTNHDSFSDIDTEIFLLELLFARYKENPTYANRHIFFNARFPVLEETFGTVNFNNSAPLHTERNK